MRRVRVLLAMGALAFSACGWGRAQEPPQATNSLPESAKKAEGATVRVCLRLDDGMPFLGEARVRMKASQGEELAGVEGSMGEYRFANALPGTYLVDVDAPGFLLQQLRTEVEAGGGQRTLFLVMNRRVVGTGETKAAEPKAEAEPTGAATFVAEPKAEAGKAGPKSEMEKAEKGAATGARDYWREHELEQVVPPVEPGAACPTDKVLAGTGRRMSEFVSTLEKFTATETVEHYTVRRSGEMEKLERREFAYVVTVSRNVMGTFLLEEFRNGSTDPRLFPAQVATLGLPALALVFHPEISGDFNFQCEGLGSWEGRQVWQVHFKQRSDRQKRMRGYQVNERFHSESLEGRAWIDPGSFQVVRLETELEQPIPEIRLRIEHTAIDYAPKRFSLSEQEIWLPLTAELYVERNDRRFYRKHAFSDFRLFNVETSQAVQAPRGSYSFTNLTDREVKGELTVTSNAEGAEGKIVTLRIALPARGRVIKMVGPGKDVNVPGTSVVAARFVYEGEDGAVRVDANLVTESTLDVVPGGVVGEKR